MCPIHYNDIEDYDIQFYKHVPTSAAQLKHDLNTINLKYSSNESALLTLF